MPAADKFQYHRQELGAPSRDFYAATKSDGTDNATVSRAIYVGTGGDVVAVPADGGAPVTFKNVPAGTILPIRCSRINSSGTTASDIVVL